VELDQDGPSGRPALLAGLAQTTGSALGPLLAGVPAQWAPAPLHLVFVVGMVVTLVAAGFTLVLPEAGQVGQEPWRIQRPRVPEDIRADFARVSLTAATVWAAVALYLSVVPKHAETLLDSDNLALLAAVSAVALAASSVAQVLAQRRPLPPTQSQAVGLALLAAGLVALVIAAPTGSLGALLAGAVVTGVGHGLAFLAAQSDLNAIAPSHRRGEVTAAFICCIYLMVGGAVTTAGLPALVMSLTTAVQIVAGGLAITAAGAAAWQLMVIRAGRIPVSRRAWPGSGR